MTRAAAALGLALLLLGGGFAAAEEPKKQDANALGQAPQIQPAPLRYQVVAGDLRIDRRVTGPVTKSIRGVPAEPVDSIVYDGVGSTPVPGSLMMEVDVASETGLVIARWTDRHGDWEYKQTRFFHPEHLSGVRLGRSMRDVENVVNHAVALNVYLHGDTTAGTAVLPTSFAYLASWGPVDVTLNGEPFKNEYGLPSPQWLGHLMITEGVRDDDDGTVRAVNGEIYDPKRHAGKGAVDPSDLELHLTFHDERFPVTGNKPAMFQFQMHMVFEDVEIKVLQANKPIPAN